MLFRGLCISAALGVACGPAVGGVAAVSCDGRWKLATGTEVDPLQLFDANGRLVRSYPASALDSVKAPRVATIDAVGVRKSFVVSFDNMPQLWEISWDPAAPPIFDGLVHDYRMAEALAQPGYLGVRRTVLTEEIEVLAIDERGQVLGISRPAQESGPRNAPVQVINLDVRRRIAVIAAGASAGAACPSTTPETAAGSPSRESPRRTDKD
jgi:hypothetical protein